MTAAREAGERVTPAREASEPTIAVPAARGLAFLALCAFAAVSWMQLLEPAASSA